MKASGPYLLVPGIFVTLVSNMFLRTCIKDFIFEIVVKEIKNN